MSQTAKFYSDCRTNFNEVRRKKGLKPILFNKKLRECLRCEKHFTSLGVHHRICDRCNAKEAYYI